MLPSELQSNFTINWCSSPRSHHRFAASAKLLSGSIHFDIGFRQGYFAQIRPLAVSGIDRP